MNFAQAQKEVKVVLLGDSGVGKSSILSRFCYNEFKDSNEPTLGAAFKSQFLQVQGQQFKFQIWDTAGQEKYKSLTPLYYRDAQVALIVYDISKKESFEVLKSWVDELKAHGPNKLVLVLVGNKSDLIEQEEVSFDEARTYANQLGALLKLTSCKDNNGIQEMFTNVGQVILDEEQKKLAQKDVDSPTKQPSKDNKSRLSSNEPQKEKKGCC